MSGGYRVPAVASAVSILRLLAQSGERGATQSELARETGISKSTMHNLLATLEDEGLVVRAERSREYRLGPLLIMLGAAASGHTQVLDVAARLLAPLPAERGLSFAIAQRVGRADAVIVERMLPPQGLHVGVVIGSRYGPFDGAIGKCLLASLPAEEAETLVRRRSLPAHTRKTITDPDTLLAEVARVRELGWAVSDQELNENNAVAAYVGARGGDPDLYLLALGFSDQLQGPQLEATGTLLVDVAQAIRAAAGIGESRVMATTR